MHDGPPDGYITSADACERLGISDRTLRRRVAAGTIQGEYLPRPQGSVLYIKMPTEAAGETAHAASAVIDSETEQAAEDTATVPPAPTEPPEIVTGLLEDLREMRQHQRDDAALIAELSSRLSRAETLVETLQGLRDQWAREANEQQEARIRAEADRDRLIAEVERLRWRWWHRWFRPD